MLASNSASYIQQITIEAALAWVGLRGSSDGNRRPASVEYRLH